MTRQEQLAMAIWVATNGHKGQFDKGDKPYILHPLHVMNELMFDPELAAMGVMHDVVEDTTYSMAQLRGIGFSDRIIDGLTLLTHTKGVSYEDYIDAIGTSLDAIRVKRKDLEHNSNITRLKGVSAKDIARMEKYHKAFIQLGKHRDRLKGKNE